ncbi:hypothetical protein FRB99_004245 [Tulasnella sp. 403]|nr:hypothetical protein FRB99_004245 [Tulasnella sp. 403]
MNIFLQEKCYLHKYIRSRDTSGIPERPERLKAVAMGIAVAVARLDDEHPAKAIPPDDKEPAGSSADVLAHAMSQLELSVDTPLEPSSCRIVHSTAAPDFVSHPAVRFVHAHSRGKDPEDSDYLSQVKTWALESAEKVASGESELPSNLHQGDMYLCPGSIDAINGADGNPELVRDASVSLHGAHGQFIENVHLEQYTSDEDFHATLYPTYCNRLFDAAKKFLKSSAATADKTLVFISCGFDACEHEHDYMSRHGRKVPVSFYERFAQDARTLADEYAGGKLVSVLEGGYSDRALMSGAMAHVAGLSRRAADDGRSAWVSGREGWWSIVNLARLEKQLKKDIVVRKSRTPRSKDQDGWFTHAIEVFGELNRMPVATPPASTSGPSRTLRERKKQASSSTKTTQTTTAENPRQSLEPKEKPVSAAVSSTKPLSKGKAKLATGVEAASGGVSGEAKKPDDGRNRDPRESPRCIKDPTAAPSSFAPTIKVKPDKEESPLMIRLKIPRPAQPEHE